MLEATFATSLLERDLVSLRTKEVLDEKKAMGIKLGKPKMVVINAVRNKLVLRIWACIREDRMYEKTYTKNLVGS